MSAAKANDRLIYMALGGAGEIGMNCYVYGYGPKGKERLIVIDLGVTFPDMDGTPGVDLIFPDITWLKERRAQIEGIFITHAHEDHVGAVGLLWEQLGAPIYARKFTANIARRKLQEKGHPDNVVTVVEPYPAVIDCGPFKVSYVPISHSIPESAGLVIDSAAGRIVHTGDFKVDMTPVVGDPFNTALWEEIAKDGVKALVCDSTNIFSPHAGRSEMSIGPAITELMRNATGMVAATTFASNIARLKTLADAAVAAGRTVCLLGRSMNRMVEAAKETGLLTNFPATIGPEDAVNVPRNQLMLLVTGSQGERRAASAQLSQGSYLGLKLKEGDTFLFSSKTIPGNEKGVIRIMNQLSELGVDIVDDDGGKYHVSGHANRPDLETMHQIIKPQFLIPMHGEHRHLREHVKVAGQFGLPGIVAVNGMMIDLSGNQPTVAEYVETGRTYLDGSVQIGAMDGVVRDRIRMALNGLAVVTVIIDENDEPLGDPWVELSGLTETGRSDSALAEIMEADLAQFIGRADAKTIRDDVKLEKELKNVARRSAQGEIGKKPEVIVVISRLG
ncbi:ribonuclease J [Loktanella salsilacus]|jgi:ribonuclease J|uniref:Ribonuclease J n=1 Tax=Loktanella salsilacus TaxID=195913 RepID=A0A1I4E644_9RHOB|nr:ribonuclease J [Loktanella salsilacus]UTH43265.1 ribonuclease J [Loktanella salsilacus]UTH46972.1 ribonuclease J [Loktanella salsilacus]SFL01235.1 ribonuclease J [Loktanella salsilacus]